jgi:quinol monooxygenase YgiN
MELAIIARFHAQAGKEAAFEVHATLKHTVKFIDTVEKLIDHPLDIVRAEVIA